MNLRAKETEECQIQIELVSCLFVYFQVTSPMQWRFSIQTTSTNGTNIFPTALKNATLDVLEEWMKKTPDD